MSVTWHNVFLVSRGGYTGTEWDSPYLAQWLNEKVEDMRVEQRWNGHWLRPPVGMKAMQTSHYWVMSGAGFKLLRAPQ